jgi:adenylate cyclase
MPTLLPGDNPQAYIPGDRRRALARGEDLPPTAHGSAVFVDISGFTPLTEALARRLGGRRGAEELTATLDRVFAALMETLHAWGGSVVYFSGDSVTGWIDGDDGSRATACGLTMQEVMGRVGTVEVAGAPAVTLGVKVAVAVGAVHRFVVGDPRVQRVDVLAGALMDSLAAAEQQARPGEVVLDAGALASLAGRVRTVTTRPGREGAVGVAEALVGRLPVAAEAPEWPDLPEETARQWLLPPVWERMAAGRGELLADLRPAVPLFVRFAGLDFERDPGAPGVLDAFVRRAQLALDDLGGSVLQLTIGDKGAYLYAVFGSPVAHEDDAARACEAALRVREIAAEVPVSDVQVGVSTGRLRSGTYGHPERRTFCCLGDAVNLAARLMARAPAGQVWVADDVAAASGDRFTWTALAPVRVKGRTGEVAVRSLEGRAGRRRGPAHLDASSRRLVGRDAELERLRSLWRGAEAGRGRVVVVEAEAGTGKSRLVAELVAGLRGAGVTVAAGEAGPAGTRAAYVAWREVWADLLGLGTEVLDPAVGAAVAGAVARLDPGLAERAPLLGPVLGLALPDNDLTSSFDGELRKASLEDLARRLLRARAERGAVAVVVEDAHWLDPLSRDLLEALARAVPGAGVLLVVTTRPDGAPWAGPTRGGSVDRMVLAPLDPGPAAVLVAERHRALSGQEPPSGLVATVVGRAEGNPFYLEQLVDYLLAHAARTDGAPDPDALELPASLHSLVLSRIDAQPEGPRRAVKVASVVGRSFGSPLVAAAYPELGDEPVVHDDLMAMSRTRLIGLEDPEDRTFAFGHAVTRDVAYDSLPFRVRTVLHGRVGDVLEQEPEGARRHLDLLAHHYALSEDLPKKRHYLRAAADAARAAYANEAAVSYLEQVLPLVEPGERHDVLLQLAGALEVGGDWAAAEDAVARARRSADEAGDLGGVARSRVARAELARKQGRYAEAEDELAAAEATFGEIVDEPGRARVLHLRGTLESQQGRPARARAAYEAALDLRERLGDEAGVAALLTNLALVAEDEDDLDAAERLGQEGLQRRRALGDRRAVSVSLTNMGMLATVRGELGVALERFVEAQGLAEEVGDPWVVAVGHHNLGNVTRDLGDLDASAGHLAAALGVYAERDDRWSLAHLFEDVALLLLTRRPGDEPDAAWLLGCAERLRLDIGAPRFPPTEEALAAALAPAREHRRPEVLDRATAEGRAAGLEQAVDRAARLLARRSA